jgi:hypothetical protein
MPQTLFATFSGLTGSCGCLAVGGSVGLQWTGTDWRGVDNGCSPPVVVKVACVGSGFVCTLNNTFVILLSGPCGPLTDLVGSNNATGFPCNGHVAVEVTS